MFGRKFVVIPETQPDKNRLLWVLSIMLLHVPSLWTIVSDAVVSTKDWYGWVLYHLWQKYLTHCGARMSVRTNPFRKTRNQEGAVSKITTTLGFEPSDSYQESQLVDVFHDLKEIMVLPIELHATSWISEDSHTTHVIIFKSIDVDPEYNVGFQELIVPDGWEARCIIDTDESFNRNSVVYSRHGGALCPSWWKQWKQGHSFVNSKQDSIPYLAPEQWNIAIFCLSDPNKLSMLRRSYLEQTGTQFNYECRHHGSFLIKALRHQASTSLNRTPRLCSIDGCQRAQYFCCRELHCCTVGICKTHFDELQCADASIPLPLSDTSDDNVMSPQVELENIDIMLEDEMDFSDDGTILSDEFAQAHELDLLSSDTDTSSESTTDSNDNGHVIATMVGIDEAELFCRPVSDTDQFVTQGVPEDTLRTDAQDNIEDDDASADQFPTTDQGAMPIQSDFPPNDIGLHVIFNKYHRLLVKFKDNLEPSSRERHFIEGILASNNEYSVPLVYP